jgi:hypothetical protein
LYGNTLSKYYKSDLISLAGKLDFTEYTASVTTIHDEQGGLLFDHLINISEIDLTGCVNVSNSGFTNQNVFSTMPSLVTLSLNGCASITGNINFSGCTKLANIDIRNTSIGIIATNN